MPTAIALSARLAVALLALASACPAQALRRSHDGAGQAVLMPYYTVLDDRATLLSIVNHSEQPKAVRFLLAEGRNGRPALTFNIYFGPRDVWTGVLVADATGARLRSDDGTCTVPAVPADGVVLGNLLFRGGADDGLGFEPERLAEGQFEAVEMGVPMGAAADLVRAQDCAALIQRFAPAGVWSYAPNADLSTPAGQLSVEAQIIDVAAGTIFDVPTVTLDEFSGGARHAAPDDIATLRFTRPTLEPGQTHFVVEGGSYLGADRPADAVSLLLMAASLEGTFLVDPSLSATTEWIVTLPTRQDYLDDRPGGVLAAGTAPVAPFSGSNGSAPRCTPVDFQIIGRDGLNWDESPVIGPFPPDHSLPNRTLCAQVSRFTIGEDIAGAPARPDFLGTYGLSSGRLRLDLLPEERRLNFGTGPDGSVSGSLHGLPVVALPLIEARNNFARPGMLATYGYTGQVVRRRVTNADF